MIVEKLSSISLASKASTIFDLGYIYDDSKQEEAFLSTITRASMCKYEHMGALDRCSTQASMGKGCINGVQPPSPPRHDITAPEEPFHVRGSIFLFSY